MNRIVLAAAAVMLSTGAALANDPTCSDKIEARGVSSHVEGGQDFERHKGQVPPGLAKRRAIQSWQLKVSTYCPSFSNKWWRARTANVSCDNGLGQERCIASATPARKLLSVLFD
jgi:hypothetical protein